MQPPHCIWRCDLDHQTPEGSELIQCHPSHLTQGRIQPVINIALILTPMYCSLLMMPASLRLRVGEDRDSDPSHIRQPKMQLTREARVAARFRNRHLPTEEDQRMRAHVQVTSLQLCRAATRHTCAITKKACTSALPRF